MIFLYSYISSLGSKVGDKVTTEPYIDIQTVYDNSPNNPLSYVDLDGRGWLVPEITETLEAAWNIGKEKGEKNTIYMHQVVAMVLDPSTRYTDTPTLGKTTKIAYNPKNLYIFYLLNEKRTHIISVGDKKYRVTLLNIDGRSSEQARYSYTFRVEEVVE